MATTPRLPRNPLFLALASLFLFACVGGQIFQGEPHGWWKEQGPVVPHETFPASCDLCHEPGSWVKLRADFTFDHEKETGVALEGAHAAARCLRCHNDRGPVASFAARGCAGCHEDVHEGMQGQSCDTCHEQQSWRVVGAITDHARTRFPLVGAHAATACRRCHEGIEAGVLAPLDVECISCHQADLARTADPNHVTNGWTDTCDRCHIPTGWRGAAFNHSTFPLTGQHRNADCSECHTNGIYAGTPRNCVDCHRQEYLNANDPNHVAAGFPESCENCHNTQRWDDANFNHFFRINGGSHGGFDCIDCHTMPNNFTEASCTHCHEHRQSEADDEHSDVNGYVWSSPQCIACHPDGRN
ncbi:MAG: hypothetical protein ACJAZN_002473 [Planctomycetota bacterium]|jgi:hypothetical protein